MHRAICDGAAEGMLLADIETKRFKYANPAICRMLGYTEEELTQMSVPDIHPKQDLEYVISIFEAQARGEKVLAAAIPCLRKDGSLLYADINTAKISIDGRDCNVGFFTDVTERKQAEEYLRESETKYRRLFEAVSDAIIIFDADTWKPCDVNEAALSLYGYDRDEALKLTPYDISAEPEESKAAIRKAVAGKLTRIPLRYYRKRDGTVFPAEISASTFMLGDRRVMCAVVRDITERKRVEEALQQAHDELETRVYERTAHLLEAKRELEQKIVEHMRAEEELAEKE
jgi:PAS domain S-box-containing protein